MYQHWPVEEVCITIIQNGVVGGWDLGLELQRITFRLHYLFFPFIRWQIVNQHFDGLVQNCVTLLLTHWNYCNIVLSHRFTGYISWIWQIPIAIQVVGLFLLISDCLSVKRVIAMAAAVEGMHQPIIDLIHKSHNAPFWNRNVHISVTKLVNCVIFVWWFVGFVR